MIPSWMNKEASDSSVPDKSGVCKESVHVVPTLCTEETRESASVKGVECLSLSRVSEGIPGEFCFKSKYENSFHFL